MAGDEFFPSARGDNFSVCVLVLPLSVCPPSTRCIFIEGIITALVPLPLLQRAWFRNNFQVLKRNYTCHIGGGEKMNMNLKLDMNLGRVEYEQPL